MKQQKFLSRKSLFFPALFSLVIALLFGCTRDEALPPEVILPGDCDSVSATYVADVLPIVQTHCSDPALGSCHQPGSVFGDFSIYADTKAKVDAGSFKNRVLVLKDMPPTYSSGPTFVPVEQLTIIQCWLENGAPN